MRQGFRFGPELIWSRHATKYARFRTGRTLGRRLKLKIEWVVVVMRITNECSLQISPRLSSQATRVFTHLIISSAMRATSQSETHSIHHSEPTIETSPLRFLPSTSRLGSIFIATPFGVEFSRANAPNSRLSMLRVQPSVRSQRQGHLMVCAT